MKKPKKRVHKKLMNLKSDPNDKQYITYNKQIVSKNI